MKSTCFRAAFLLLSVVFLICCQDFFRILKTGLKPIYPISSLDTTRITMVMDEMFDFMNLCFISLCT